MQWANLSWRSKHSCKIKGMVFNSLEVIVSNWEKGLSITERPEYISSRKEFGHWEGDLVTGPRDGQNGAYLI